MTTSHDITVLAGGVGAAKFLRGLIEAHDPASCTTIVNVADDFRLHGLAISPDLDTVTYTLADLVNPETGWGRRDESWTARTELERLGGETWFSLGDKDLALHLHRTGRLAAGSTLAEVTAEVTRSLGIEVNVLPVTNAEVATKLTLLDGSEIDFQDYFVARRHDVAVAGVRFAGAETAEPAAGVLDAIRTARTIVIAPSNPIVSIGPLLAVPGVREALVSARDRTVAISPIVGGKALKGPADRLLRELGHESSVVGVAKIYRDLAATLVIDTVDEGFSDAVESEAMHCLVTDTIMADVSRSAALATTILESRA